MVIFVFGEMDAINFLMTLAVFSSPPVILFSIIFLILRYIFKVKNRILNAIITLVICLVSIFLLVWIVSGFGLVRLDFIFPWTNCYELYGYFDYFDSTDCGWICEVGPNIDGALCKLIQIWEWSLIATAASVIIVPYLYHKVKGLSKKR